MTEPSEPRSHRPGRDSISRPLHRRAAVGGLSIGFFVLIGLSSRQTVRAQLCDPFIECYDVDPPPTPVHGSEGPDGDDGSTTVDSQRRRGRARRRRRRRG